MNIKNTTAAPGAHTQLSDPPLVFEIILKTHWPTKQKLTYTPQHKGTGRRQKKTAKIKTLGMAFLSKKKNLIIVQNPSKNSAVLIFLFATLL